MFSFGMALIALSCLIFLVADFFNKESKVEFITQWVAAIGFGFCFFSVVVFLGKVLP